MANAGAAISGGISVLGGISGKKAANKAAQQQNAANEAAIAEERRQFDLTRGDLAPYRETGTAANNRLAELLGLDTGQNTNISNAQAEFDRANTAYNNAVNSNNNTNNNALSPASGHNSLGGYVVDTWNRPTSYGNKSNSVDLTSFQNRLDAAKAGLTTARNMPTSHSSDFGSLMKDFSQNDLNADPVYQNGLKFGLDQGTGAIDARARANGNWDSGAVLKELSNYANDYGTTKANDSYNRFNNNKTTKYNFLTGISGSGQQAVNTGVQAGSTSSNNIASLLGQGGAARSAGTIGGANAISGALSGLGKQNWGDMFQKNPTMNYTGFNSGTNSYYSG